MSYLHKEMKMSEELRQHPESGDPAYQAGMDFAERYAVQDATPWAWMVRQAFWCGVRWARKHSVPVAGIVGEGGKITWKEKP